MQITASAGGDDHAGRASMLNRIINPYKQAAQPVQQFAKGTARVVNHLALGRLAAYGYRAPAGSSRVSNLKAAVAVAPPRPQTVARETINIEKVVNGSTG